jgi:NADH dehydrogenase
VGLPTERGRIAVAGDLSVPGHPGVCALGDCAHVPNAHDGKSAPPTAQFAVREAYLLTRDIIAAVTRSTTRIPVASSGRRAGRDV